MATTNGSPVTRSEFNMLREDVSEVKADVKSLLAAHNQDEGAAKAARTTKDIGARRLAFTATAVGGLWWVQDAIAKLTHHS